MSPVQVRVLALLVPLAACGVGVGEVSGGETLAEAQRGLTGAVTWVEVAQGANGPCARVSMPTFADVDADTPSVVEHCDAPQDTFDAAKVEAVVELDLTQLPTTSSGLAELTLHFQDVLRTLETRRATRAAIPPVVAAIILFLARGALTTPPMGDQRPIAPPPPPPIPQHNGKTERWTVTYEPAGFCMVRKVTVVELCRVNASNQVSQCNLIATFTGQPQKVEPCEELGKLVESRTVTYSVPGQWAGPAR